MSEHDLLAQTLRAILDKGYDRAVRETDRDGFPSAVWTTLDEAGLTTLGDVGNEVGTAELVLLAQAVGRAAVPVPLTESAGLAAWLASAAGLELPPGISTCAAHHPDDRLDLVTGPDGPRVDGVLHRVPWARSADHVVATTTGPDPHLVVLPVSAELVLGRNLAGEPRDTLRVVDFRPTAGQLAPAAVPAREALLRGALLRAASMAGAMEAVLGLTLDHADARKQFGRPISDFQAVQHHLVAIAEEALFTTSAVNFAAAADDDHRAFAIAAAKATAGRAARVVARRAHQVFAAVGVTQESALPWFTARLWAWENEFGSTGSWTTELGSRALQVGGPGLWPLISDTISGSGTR